MSIITTTTKYRYESVETSMYVGEHYDHTTKSYTSYHGPLKPTMPLPRNVETNDTHFYTETTVDYIGCVVNTVQENVRVMSDVWEYQTYAIVYDNTSGSFKNVFVGGCEFERFTSYTVTIDTTSEILEAYQAWLRGHSFKLAELSYDRAQKHLHEERTIPSNGKYVEVTKGRKVPRGTKGLVFWCGQDNYGNAKVGIATTRRKNERNGYMDVVWTAKSNCTVINNYSLEY